jgi:hypothetical protein
MNKIGLILIAMLFSANIFGQNELQEGQYKGYILTKKGKQEGIIWVSGWINTPWSHQKKVSFITEEGFKQMKKNKRKYFEDYKPKDILGYGYEGAEFVSVKYADLSAVGPDMLPKMYFLRALVQGEISVYRFYRTPPSVQSGEEINKTNEEWAEDNELVIVKGKEKAKNAERIEMMDIIGDCQTVKDKYLDGGYGFEPKNDGSKDGLKKVFAKMGDRSKIDEAITKIAKEYNECK